MIYHPSSLIQIMLKPENTLRNALRIPLIFDTIEYNTKKYFFIVLAQSYSFVIIAL